MRLQTFLQKSSDRIPLGTPVIDLAVTGDGAVWAATEEGLGRIEGGQWVLEFRAKGIAALAVDGAGRLWVATDEGAHLLEGDRLAQYGPHRAVRALAVSGTTIACAMEKALVFLRPGGSPEVSRLEGFVPRCLCLGAAGDLWCATDRGLIHRDDSGWSCLTTENSPLECDDVRAVACDGTGHVWIGTARGIQVTAGGTGWHSLGGRQGLPVEEVHTLSLGKDGSCWVGTARGAARLRDGCWEYFGGRRWLPDDAVRAVWALPDGGAWVATDGGVARIRYTPMTLEEKAALFEERITARHERWGYVTSCLLERPGELETFVHEASDNDGLWTALYLAAQCFQYGATGDPGARRRARRSLEALLRLEAVTPIPGFPARAVVRVGERVEKSRGEWHVTDDGQWEWKGDTSSDEIDGHYFAYAVYFDLVADAEEKRAIAAVVRRITDHILDHDFTLVDLDGKPTRWGMWNPRVLNEDPEWRAERGLNALEILSHLRTAHHITGEKRYLAAYRQLITDEHYALNTITQKITREQGEDNHSDDELAFISYYPLLRYEDDPALRRLYLLSLERSWRIERPERCPLWNLIYGALTGRPCDADEALHALQRIPLELIEWDVRNSHRSDLVLDPGADRFGRPQSATALPPDERAMMKWNGNPYQLDGGNGGRSEDDGTFFLLPYWLGRYHGLIPGPAA